MLGYCTTPDGESVQYSLRNGLPTWSLEYARSLASSGAAGTPSSTEARSSKDGSEEPDVRSSGPGSGAGAPPSTPTVTASPGVDSSSGAGDPDGASKDEAAAGLLFLSGPGPSVEERPGPLFASEPSAEDEERTECGSPGVDAKKPRTERPVSLPLQPVAAANHRPVAGTAVEVADPEARHLASLSADQLADRMQELTMRQLPLVTPRLRTVLAEYGVFAADCPPGYPKSLAAAAFALDADAFGRSTPKVVQRCMAVWRDIAASEARATGTSVAVVTARSAAHKDRALAPAPAPASPFQLVSDAEWARLVPPPSARGRPLPRSDALGELPPRGTLASSEAIEANERYIAGAQLLAVVPAFMHHAVVGLSPDELEQLRVSEPLRVQGLFRALFGSYTEGSISGCRRALNRLIDWLAERGMTSAFSDQPPWLVVSGGILSMFVQDMQAVSRNGAQKGQSVPASLKAGLTWAHARLGLVGLEVRSPILLAVAAPQSAQPKQALSFTVRVHAHFAWLRVRHESSLVRLYAAALELLCVASLRMRDAQRAVLSYTENIRTYGLQPGVTARVPDRVGHLQGLCFTSKHPKRRSKKAKLFFAPKRAGEGGDALDGYIDVLVAARADMGGEQWDYIFPRVAVPRGSSLDAEGVKLLGGPAPSAEVIRHMCGLLRLPPLSLSAEAAAAFSGHSGRHYLVTFAKSVASASAPPRYSDDELSLLGDWADGRMVTLYSSEQYEESKLALLSRLLADIGTVLSEADKAGEELPASGGWADLAKFLRPTESRGTFRLRKKPPTGELEPEASDSESDSDDE